MPKDLLNRAGKMSVVLIFNICNAYEIVAYEWLYLPYWGRVKMVDMASKIAVSFNCVSLVFFFCEVEKLSKSVFSSFKRMT